MRHVSSSQFAECFGISRQAAHKAFSAARKGKMWHGHALPVVELHASQGGAAGRALGLLLDATDPELRAKLEHASTAIEAPLQRRVDDNRLAVALDRQRVVALALAHPRGSADRSKAIKELAATQHRIGTTWAKVSERTLYQWIKTAEINTIGLLPKARSDKGQRRFLISAAWDGGCGLPDHVQQRIAAELARTARGLIGKGRSAANVRRLCATKLEKLTVEAGADLSVAALKKTCKISQKWTDRFNSMTAVHAFNADHKVYADKHEFHIKRGLTAHPMEALMGDVHTVDVAVPEALSSAFEAVRAMGFAAAMAGKVTVQVWFIAWMDAASGYMWTTPVITGPGCQ